MDTHQALIDLYKWAKCKEDKEKILAVLAQLEDEMAKRPQEHFSRHTGIKRIPEWLEKPVWEDGENK